MTRRSPRRRSGWDAKALPPAGLLAHFDGTCDRCGGTITRLADQVVERKGAWIHARCAPGADDE